MIERGKLTLKQLAKDAGGLTAFNSARAAFDCKDYWPWDIGSHIFSVHAAAKEYIFPIDSRLTREGIGVGKWLGWAAMVRDFSTAFYATGVSLATLIVTKNFNLGVAAFFASKFFLNGAVHYEMYKSYQKHIPTSQVS